MTTPLAELQVRMSRSWIFVLFLHHTWQVPLLISVSLLSYQLSFYPTLLKISVWNNHDCDSDYHCFFVNGSYPGQPLWNGRHDTSPRKWYNNLSSCQQKNGNENYTQRMGQTKCVVTSYQGSADFFPSWSMQCGRLSSQRLLKLTIIYQCTI